MGFLYAAILVSAFALVDGSYFSEKYFIVYFDPMASRHDDMDRDDFDVYNEDEIIFMVSLVSTRFKRLIMRSIAEDDIKTNSEFSPAKIPLAVAKFNKFHRNDTSETPLELIMLFHILSRKTRWRTSFEFVKDRADKANQVFPGTVTHLMLDLSDIELSSKIASVSEHLADCKSKIMDGSPSPFPYKLGAIVKKELCYKRNQTWSVLAQLIPQLDTIIFIYQTKKSDFNYGVDPNALQPFYSNFESCKKTLLGEGFLNIEVMYKIGWPGMSTKANEILKLVHFWELMNSWAVSSETPVVLHKAFDNKLTVGLAFEKVNQSTSGWWRLVESSEYVTALDYEFEEKKFGITNRSDNAMMDTSWLTTCFPNTTGNNSNFNLPNLAIVFNPDVSHQNISVSFSNYSEIDLNPLLLLASTEFTTILVEANPYDTATGDYNMLQVPIAVAKLSKQGRFQSPLKVVLVFRCQACKRPKLNESIIMNSEFDEIQKVADEANSIFPSSVPTLLMKYDYLKTTSLRHIVRELVDARRKLKMSPNPIQNYRLGALFPLRDCESSRTKLKPTLLPIILEHVDILVFDFAPFASISDKRLKSRPTADDLTLTVEESLGGYLRLVRFCTAKIHRHRKNLEVGYMLTWPDTNDKGVGKLVEFWGKVRRWAEATNTTVFMSAAFDTQFQGNPLMSTRGWWRLIPNDSPGNTSDYVFEDKKSVFLRQLAELSQESANLTTEPNLQDGNNEGGTSTTIVLSLVAAIVLLAFGIGFVVLTKYRNRNGDVVLLTKEEIYDFFNGEGTSFSLQPLHPGASNNVPTTAYNRDLEYSHEEFELNEDRILGQGEFGIVYQAKLRKGDGAELDVAAKTTKSSSSSSSSSSALKGILSEIRILGYLGSHENIVSIVGAYTAELRLGKVFIFTELCTLGCLKDILPTIKPIMFASLNNMTECNAEGEQGSDCDDDYVDQEDFEVAHNASSLMTITPSETSELLQWAHEVSCGMEFLASKHVVHADLATRNVLLTEERVAKISDFGLSRRLYDYKSYFKKQKEPLPWRTMAPESLRHLEFNEKTDVWAFGVTLWEIFSLGEVPYAGLMWSADFANILENGLRLTQPRYDSQNMFSIMSKCWELDRNQRPKFSDLRAILEGKKLPAAYTKIVDGDDTTSL